MPEIFSSIVAAELAVDAVLAVGAVLAGAVALAEAPVLVVETVLAEAPVLIGDGDDGVGVGIVGHAPLRVAFAWFAHCFRIVSAVSSAQLYVQSYARSAV